MKTRALATSTYSRSPSHKAHTWGTQTPIMFTSIHPTVMIEYFTKRFDISYVLRRAHYTLQTDTRHTQPDVKHIQSKITTVKPGCHIIVKFISQRDEGHPLPNGNIFTTIKAKISKPTPNPRSQTQKATQSSAHHQPSNTAHAEPSRCGKRKHEHNKQHLQQLRKIHYAQHKRRPDEMQLRKLRDTIHSPVSRSHFYQWILRSGMTLLMDVRRVGVQNIYWNHDQVPYQLLKVAWEPTYRNIC